MVVCISVLCFQEYVDFGIGVQGAFVVDLTSQPDVEQSCRVLPFGAKGVPDCTKAYHNVLLVNLVLQSC
jgi:hypothetical protein